MPNKERVVIVHLSDLHMGSVRNGFYSPKSVRAGWNGHDPDLLPRLTEALQKVRGPKYLNMAGNEPLYLVVSGDLTCVGRETEVTLTHTFLRRELMLDGTGTRHSGLRAVPGLCLLPTVPGNHDHWNGKYLTFPAYNASLFPDFFSDTPWTEPPPTHPAITGPGKRLHVRLFGVDSNSGLSHRHYNPRAKGRIARHEFADLKHRLEESCEEEKNLSQGCCLVRAVVCHHSLNANGQPPPPPAPVWKAVWRGIKKRVVTMALGHQPDPLVPLSAQKLIRYAHRYRVRAILTGHAHYFLADPHKRQGRPTVWELRCGTTLAGPASDRGQGFYVHEVRLDNGKSDPVWEYRTCLHVNGTFDIPTSPTPLS